MKKTFEVFELNYELNYVFEDGGQIIFFHIYNKALFFERFVQWRRQTFQTGGHFIRWKIVGGGHTKKQSKKKRYHFITLGVQHLVHLFIHA